MGKYHRRQTRTAATAAAPEAAPNGEGMDSIAASFDWQVPGLAGQCPVYVSPYGGMSLIDRQKFRNNWSKQRVRDQIRACRHYARHNWFVKPVVNLRAASHGAGFRVIGEEPDYDLGALVHDIVLEDLVSSNIVCLWRTGSASPDITVLDAERCEYNAIGGLEKITLQCSADPQMQADKVNKAAYVSALGERMYEACCVGKSMTILRDHDEEWNFAYMGDGKRSGAFVTPALLPFLDPLDFIELMGVGDWNLGWYRKDVIRAIRKGYKVTQGQGAALNSVNITQPDVTQIGDGFSKINGNATVPMNHDMDPFYLTVSPDNFDPKVIKTAMDKIMLFGGIEGVVLLGNFSQQNGAAPSLMRNARTEAFARRGRIERLLHTILEAEEFRGLVKNSTTARFGWSVKSLYSIEELNALSNGMAPGIGSPQTRRGLYDLDVDTESQLMAQAHANREHFTPPFEGGQGMVPLVFHEEFGGEHGEPSGEPGQPGRPANEPGV